MAWACRVSKEIEKSVVSQAYENGKLPREESTAQIVINMK